MGAEEIDLEADARRYASNPYLLDTCTLLWVTNDPERLSKSASAIWRDPNRIIAVSVVNYWEIAVKKDKLSIRDVTWYWEHRVLPYVDIEPVQIREEHIAELLLLPQLHKDPFDRILIAQARVENMLLVTSDQKVQEYDVRTVW
jgi:PIN domain nuclease of toxin-antitoxin system